MSLNEKITAKTLKSPLSGTEELPLNDAGQDYKTTTQDIANLAGGGFSDVVQSQPSKSLDTVYHNTTGKVLFIYVTVEIQAAALPNDTILATALCDSSSTPSTQMMQVGTELSTANADNVYVIPLIVPNGYYYEIQTFKTGGNVQLVNWTEYAPN